MEILSLEHTIESMYIKDFEGWNKQKQRIEKGFNGPDLVLQGEIWWCGLGINIGVEIDGKNDAYERPVLVLKHINRYTILVAPFTSTNSSYRYIARIKTDKIDSFVNLAQIRVISKKRLFRHIDTLEGRVFLPIKGLLVEFLS